jgi:hypothetical protein
MLLCTPTVTSSTTITTTSTMNYPTSVTVQWTSQSPLGFPPNIIILLAIQWHETASLYLISWQFMRTLESFTVRGKLIRDIQDRDVPGIECELNMKHNHGSRTLSLTVSCSSSDHNNLNIVKKFGIDRMNDVLKDVASTFSETTSAM